MALTNPTIAKLLCSQQYGPTLLAWYTPGSRKSLFVRGGRVGNEEWGSQSGIRWDRGFTMLFPNILLNVSLSALCGSLWGRA